MIDQGDYCRQLETYLCQKNGGHLVRIVGPAFELVRSWAQQGVPLTVARSGVDRYCERQQAKGGRRRPVRIEFCEPDILSAFDAWRRAVGIVHQVGAQEEPAPRKSSLATHIERAVARLTARRTAGSEGFEREIQQLLEELDRIGAEAAGIRGQARAAAIERLDELDRRLIAAALADLDAARSASLRREAEQELSGVGGRMTPEARARSLDAAYQRLVRETLALPTLSYV